MNRDDQKLLVIFIATYFGEPFIARLMDTTSSTLRQLAIFLVLIALFKLISVRWLMWGTILVIALLAGLVAMAPQATAVYTVTVAAYGLAVALLVRVMVDLWQKK